MQGRLRYNTPALLFLVDLDYELSFRGRLFNSLGWLSMETKIRLNNLDHDVAEEVLLTKLGHTFGCLFLILVHQERQHSSNESLKMFRVSVLAGKG